MKDLTPSFTEASDTARVQACNGLLDRGWGKAPQYTENVNLGMTYVEYLEMVTKEENEKIKPVEVCNVDDL